MTSLLNTFFGDICNSAWDKLWLLILNRERSKALSLELPLVGTHPGYFSAVRPSHSAATAQSTQETDSLSPLMLSLGSQDYTCDGVTYLLLMRAGYVFTK